MQRPVQDDLDDVIGYLIIEVAAKRPAEPVLILVKASRSDVSDGVEDRGWIDGLLSVRQRYQDGVAVGRVRLAGQPQGEVSKANRVCCGLRLRTSLSSWAPPRRVSKSVVSVLYWFSAPSHCSSLM